MPITVLNVNLGPQVAAIANQKMEYDTTLDLPVQALDPQGDPVVLTVAGLPTFATFVDNGNDTGQFQFAPGPGDGGNYTITLTATDNGDGNGPFAVLSDSQSFVLTVNAPIVPNLAPSATRWPSSASRCNSPCKPATPARIP